MAKPVQDGKAPMVDDRRPQEVEGPYRKEQAEHPDAGAGQPFVLEPQGHGGADQQPRESAQRAEQENPPQAGVVEERKDAQRIAPLCWVSHRGVVDGSVAEVVELQRDVEFGVLEQGDDRLQVVALLAGDAHLLAVDLGLDLAF